MTREKAVKFAEKYSVKKVYDKIDEVFTDKNVDIIYITTPHNTHYKYMKKALENGKHIFVEKSITLNSLELSEMVISRRGLENRNRIRRGLLQQSPFYQRLNSDIRLLRRAACPESCSEAAALSSAVAEFACTTPEIL